MKELAIARACIALLIFLPGSSNQLRADALEEIRERGELVWGADEEGGGPYVFRDPEDPDRMLGFEVELAEMLAEELGVKPRFQQGQWDQLPSLLARGTIDVVLNGYELTPERAERYGCTRPYYLYGLQLLAPRSGPIQSWDDLRNPPQGKRFSLGALTGSAAETYLRTQLGDSVEVITYDGNTDAMSQAANGVIDATLQDDCIALFYADRFPELKFVGRPVGEGYYVAMVPDDQPRLQEALNDALQRIIDDGRLKALYDRWDMSGRLQSLLLQDTPQVASVDRRSGLEVVRTNLGLLLSSAGMTIFLAVVSMPLAIAVGILVAIGRMYGPWPLAKLLGLYVEVLRGTPLMLQLFVIFFLLPEIGIIVPALVAAITGLAVNYSAYEAEIYRAGLQAIPRGQMEAALALGMTRAQAVRRIVLPQAVRLVIPPVTNDFIALFKDTSVCSVVTVVELTKRYNVLAQSTGAILELAAVTAALYMLMSYPLSLVARYSERRLAHGARH